MSSPAVHVRFVGMLACLRCEALARACIRSLDAAYGAVARWDVSLQPPLARWCGGGYAVRAQACMNDGSVLSIRAQGDALEATVREAFGGLEQLLQQESGALGAAWMPALVAAQPQARQ